METVHIKINNVPYEVAAGSTILEAAHSVGIEIPTLCYLKEINEIGACRICVVEVKGARSLVTACVYPVNEGMEIVTNSEKVQASRKTNLELLLSTHDQNCLSCVRSTDCELQKLCRDYGVNGMRFIGSRERYAIDAYGARRQQVHPVPPLCGRLQGQPGRGCDRRQRARLLHAHRLRV